MATGKRVLTVTYGTFSCTLEGFDDAFSTMKAITQYFRDLAAEDRQFGAELPKPNTEALKRIAERELSRGVDASMEDTGLVLRPSDRIPGDGARDVSKAPQRAAAPQQPAKRAPQAKQAPATTKPAPKKVERPPSPDDVAPKGMGVPKPKSLSRLDTPKHMARTGPRKSGGMPSSGRDPVKGLDGLRAKASGGNISAKFQQRSADVLAQSEEKKRQADSAESVADKLSRIRSAAAHTPVSSKQAPLGSSVPEDEVESATESSVAFASVRQKGDAPDAKDVNPNALLLSPSVRADKVEDVDNAQPAPSSDAEQQRDADDGALRKGVRKGQKLRDNPGEASVARLVETANTQLEGEENRRRHSAIAHLKAAVAATTADREAGVEEDDGSQAINSYRDALSQIVQPNQSGGDMATPPEPVSPPPMAPLVLVSSQRIREPERGAPYIPETFMARPTGEEGDADGPAPRQATVSFEEFASLSDADDLIDLLEVASAYLTVHEGRNEFSRQLIMQTVAKVADDGEIPREEGLTAFGTLLRDGRIVKGRRGLFSLPETSRYAKVAGG